MSTLRNKTKAEPQRSGMTHAKWREVRNIWGRKSAARWVHRGGTYNVGRNKAKREKRAAEAVARANFVKTKADVAAIGRAFGIYN